MSDLTLRSAFSDSVASFACTGLALGSERYCESTACSQHRLAAVENSSQCGRHCSSKSQQEPSPSCHIGLSKSGRLLSAVRNFRTHLPLLPYSLLGSAAVPRLNSPLFLQTDFLLCLANS